MKNKSTTAKAFVVGLLFLIAGCAAPREEAEKQMASSGWQAQVVETPTFDLETAMPAARYGQTMWVYLEGDGLAYITPEHPAWDPTPFDPIGLRLALEHPGDGPVAYIARPCQYVFPEHDKGCTEKYWTDARYAPEVIQSTDIAIDALKTQTHASNLVLVGYAGGGSLAVLTASTRKDVIGIVTIASNLDLAYWTDSSQMAPLRGSRDPADVAAGAVANIPQFHFVGDKDKVVDSETLASFLKRVPRNAPTKTVILPGYTHTCCWVENWGDLFRKVEELHYFPFNKFNILP